MLLKLHGNSGKGRGLGFGFQRAAFGRGQARVALDHVRFERGHALLGECGFGVCGTRARLVLGRDLQQQGKSLQVTGLPPRLRDLVALYGVESLLPA